MKIGIIILTIFILTRCGIDCISKKTGIHQASPSVAESKKNSVFQFEMEPNKLKFSLDSGRTFEIEKAWVEYSWTYQCVNNKATITKDNFMQLVIKSKTIPNSITYVDYAIMEKGKGVFFESSHLNFSYKGQDTVFLQLVKFKAVLDSNKTYFDKIKFTKKISR